jgi:hypothetical protein
VRVDSECEAARADERESKLPQARLERGLETERAGNAFEDLRIRAAELARELAGKLGVRS